MNDQVQAVGTISATLVDENGNIKQRVDGANLVVNSGTALIATILAGTSTSYVTYMAVGTSNTPVAATQTALGAEIARVTTATSVSTNVITYTSSFGPGVGTGTIYECGLFNAATAGTMLSRSLDLTVPKGASDTLNVFWNITISGS